MEAGRETFERVADGIHRQRRTTPRYSRQPISARTSARTGEERYKRILPCRGCRRPAGDRPAHGPWARPLPLRIRQRLHAHARAQAARRRKPRIALGHGMAVPAPVVARTARGTGHTTVDEPQGATAWTTPPPNRCSAISRTSSTATANSTRKSGSRPSSTTTSSTGTPNDARCDSVDTPWRNSGERPPWSEPVS